MPGRPRPGPANRHLPPLPGEVCVQPGEGSLAASGSAHARLAEARNRHGGAEGLGAAAVSACPPPPYEAGPASCPIYQRLQFAGRSDSPRRGSHVGFAGAVRLGGRHDSLQFGPVRGRAARPGGDPIRSRGPPSPRRRFPPRSESSSRRTGRPPRDIPRGRPNPPLGLPFRRSGKAILMTTEMTSEFATAAAATVDTPGSFRSPRFGRIAI